MRLYHFTSLHFGKLALKNQRIKISHIDDLNDPYELIGADLTDPELRSAYIKMRDEISQKQGIVCLSRRWSLPIMWSHYADKHRGICLGFDVAEPITFVVRYRANRESFIKDMLGEHNAEEHMLRLLGTKHEAWSYEDEIRLFISLDIKDEGHYFQYFNEHLALKEVIAGVRTDNSALAELRLLTGMIGNDIDVFKSDLSNTNFEVIRAKS
jgi:hypothetical protein